MTYCLGSPSIIRPWCVNTQFLDNALMKQGEQNLLISWRPLFLFPRTVNSPKILLLLCLPTPSHLTTLLLKHTNPESVLDVILFVEYVVFIPLMCCLLLVVLGAGPDRLHLRLGGLVGAPGTGLGTVCLHLGSHHHPNFLYIPSLQCFLQAPRTMDIHCKYSVSLTWFFLSSVLLCAAVICSTIFFFNFLFL